MAKAITRAIRMATRQNPTISNGPTDFPLVLPRVVVPGALVFVFPVGPVEAAKQVITAKYYKYSRTLLDEYLVITDCFLGPGRKIISHSSHRCPNFPVNPVFTAQATGSPH